MESAGQMPKPNSRKRVEEVKTVDTVETVKVPKPVFNYRRVVSGLDAKLYVTGEYSGREYLFDGAGSVVDVDTRDVEWLLEKRQAKGCCGGGGETPIFYLVED